MGYFDWLADGITENVAYFAEYVSQFDMTWEITVPQLASAATIGTVLGGAITFLFI